MKDKVLHTRVSEELYEKISKKARKHRTTTSNLIRNLVEDSIGIYNDVADVIDMRIKKHVTDPGTPLGIQKITLTHDQKCDHCNKNIKKGKEVFVELYKNTDKKTLLCLVCQKKQ